MGQPVSLQTLAIREYWSCGDAAKVLGRSVYFWSRLFDEGKLVGYRTDKGTRFFQSASARAYLAALCELHNAVAQGPSSADLIREGRAEYERRSRELRAKRLSA